MGLAVVGRRDADAGDDAVAVRDEVLGGSKLAGGVVQPADHRSDAVLPGLAVDRGVVAVGRVDQLADDALIARRRRGEEPASELDRTSVITVSGLATMRNVLADDQDLGVAGLATQARTQTTIARATRCLGELAQVSWVEGSATVRRVRAPGTDAELMTHDTRPLLAASPCG